MVYNHSRKTRQNYKKVNATDKSVDCTFCERVLPENVVAETPNFTIAHNRTPYDIWEHHKVADHLLVIPKRHVDCLGALQDTELLEQAKICADYESQGFSIYSRAVGSPRRSVLHQHTHLIKIEAEAVRLGLLVKKPYINIQI